MWMRLGVAFIAAAALAATTAACGGQRFGSVVTEITPAPDAPGLLHVRTCELVYKKAKPQKVFFGDCKRFGLRRSAIVPVPVTEGAVPPREHRIVTGIREREGGGATVTTCNLTTARDASFVLADCAELDIATATIETAPPPPGAP